MNQQSRAIRNFEANLASVERLMGFDSLVLDLLGQSLANLKAHLAKHEITNQYMQPDRLISTIGQIRANASLRPYYEAMYNQCLVLSASYFASAVRDLFVDGIGNAAQTLDARLVGEDIKLKVELLLDEDIERHILVDIIVAQAVRHAVVHAGAKVDRRLLSQIRKASPRSFEPALALDQPIKLTPDEVRLCGQSMLTYLRRLNDIVREAAI
jgi:hypothetical protein